MEGSLVRIGRPRTAWKGQCSLSEEPRRATTGQGRHEVRQQQQPQYPGTIYRQEASPGPISGFQAVPPEESTPVYVMGRSRVHGGELDGTSSSPDLGNAR